MFTSNGDIEEEKQIDDVGFKDFITKKIIRPSYLQDIRDMIRWRFIWRKIANVLYAFSKFLIMIGSMIAFFESYFQIAYLALISGSISLLGVLILQYGDFANKQQKKNTHDLNIILTSLNLKTIPQISNESTNDNVSRGDKVNDNEVTLDVKPHENKPDKLNEIKIDIREIQNETKQ